MKAHEALIAWNPVDTPDAGDVDGKIAVGEIPYYTFDWTYRYVCTGGASVPGREELHGDALKLALFLEFHELVVRDGRVPRHRRICGSDCPRCPRCSPAFFRGTSKPETRGKGRLERRVSIMLRRAGSHLCQPSARWEARQGRNQSGEIRQCIPRRFREGDGVAHLQRGDRRGQAAPSHPRAGQDAAQIVGRGHPGQSDKPFEPAGLYYFMGPQGLVVERGMPGAKASSVGPEPDSLRKSNRCRRNATLRLLVDVQTRDRRRFLQDGRKSASAWGSLRRIRQDAAGGS